MSKRLFSLGCVVLLSFGNMLFGDVIQPDYHPVSRCVTIGNCNSYPDIVVIGIYNGPTTDGNVAYLVQQDSCLQKGYKFNTLGLFWVQKDYFDSEGVEGLPTEQMGAMVSAKKRQEDGAVVPVWGLITAEIEPYGGTVPDENTLVSEEITYWITRPDGDISLIQAKKVSYFEDGTESVEDFLETSLRHPMNGRNSTSSFSVDAILKNGYLLMTPNTPGVVNGTLLDCNGRVVARFSRNGSNGSTYMIPCAAGSGMYWLQVQLQGIKKTVQLTSFR